MTKIYRCYWLVLIFLTGCSVLQSQQDVADLEPGSIAVVPLINLSQTPQAGEQAASILAAILRASGREPVKLYLPEDRNPLLFSGDQGQRSAMAAAQEADSDYVVTGTVEEWRYKSGLDGEPAVGITLEVRAADGESVLWSGTSARTGWGRESLSVAAHKVLNELADAMPLAETR